MEGVSFVIGGNQFHERRLQEDLSVPEPERRMDILIPAKIGTLSLLI